MEQLANEPWLCSVGRALPAHYADQETLTAALRELWATQHHNPARLEELHRSVQVKGRYLALPVDSYAALDTFERRNDAWLRCAEDLGAEAVSRALELAGLGPREVDHLMFVTVTGIATPGVDARLVQRLGMRPDVKRTPIFGLGCVAGAAGTARAADYLRGFPDHVAVLLSVELCSLTHRRDDASMANVIASGLFGDGAAAVLLAGSALGPARGPRVLASTSVLYPGTERVMGWEVGSQGFKIVLSAQVPDIVRKYVRADVDGFLASQGLCRGDIRHWVAHTGGPKVLSALEEALELGPGALVRSRRSLSEIGNLSSASVLFVLGDLLDSEQPKAGDLGVLMAMGPGFCSELVLLQW
jgi:alkylresorcinol/alkylpyrone synthase